MIQFIDTEACERVPQGPGLGTAAEVMGPERCGARNGRGLLRRLGPGERVEAQAMPGARQLLYLEYQAPNRFKTTILEGTEDDLRWRKVDGKIWVQT